MIKVEDLWCKIGWHRPLRHHTYLFTDVVSGLKVYKCECPCGKQWMTDSLNPYKGFKIKRTDSNGISYNKEPEDE